MAFADSRRGHQPYNHSHATPARSDARHSVLTPEENLRLIHPAGDHACYTPIERDDQLFEFSNQVA